ncbi:MAG TPA: fibronectin type III domain-containing protein [Tepidisphaeraceae bacterium]|nr:fibronectin type III domain-containing protein [Tepidisphaeraceae bacterium]
MSQQAGRTIRARGQRFDAWADHHAIEPMERRLLLSAVNVLGYHNDAASTGQNLSETALTPVSVNSESFGKIHSTSLDGQVYAQPLYVSGVNVSTGSAPGIHNVTYVATEHDSLYAIDADTGAALWKDSFLVVEPALAAQGSVMVTTLPSSDAYPGAPADITPEIGITSTPAIDLGNGFLYLTAATKQVVNGDSSNPHFVYTLYKVDIQSGAFSGTVIGDTSYDSSSNVYTHNSGPSVADPGGNGDGVVNVGGNNEIIFNALRQLNRTAVTLNHGSVFLGFASYGDIFPYHGWILGYDENTLAPTAVFCANPNGDDCGIWMGGGKIAVDPQGYMYVETGNGLFDGTLNAQGFPINGDYGDSFLKLAIDPTTSASNPGVNGWGLKVVDYFTPSDQQTLNFQDFDLGSGGPLLLPATAGAVTLGDAAHPNLLVGAGKEGVIYLIDTNNMGHYNAGGPDRVLQELPALNSGGSYDTPAFYFDGATARIYYISSNDAARSFTIANALLTPDAVSPDGYGLPEGSTSISADQNVNGIAWNIDPDSNELRAYDAGNLGQELWTSDQAAAGRDALGQAVKFASPTVANGQVFVGTGNALVVYGLLSPPTSAPASPANLSAASTSTMQATLNWQVLSSGATGFDIEASTDGGTTFTQTGIAGAGASSYVAGALQPGTTYMFRVRAFNAVGNSGYTNSAAVTTLPLAPGGVVAVGGVGQVQLNWNAVTGASSYSIYRGASPGGEAVTPLATGVIAAGYTDFSVSPATMYYYEIVAVDASGPSARSAETAALTAVVINATSAGDNITLRADSDHLHVDWTLGSSGGQVLLNSAAGLAINGGGGNDAVTLDYTNGNPLPRALHLNGTFTVSGLQGTNPLAGTTLEIGRSTVFIGYSGPDPIAAIVSYLRTGYNNGAWNGMPSTAAGVITSQAAQNNPNHNTAIGYADSADGLGVNTMPNTIELKYTLYGDADLNTNINSADLQILLFGLNRTGAWDEGDFNYDGFVNSADLQVLLATLNTNLGAQSAPPQTSGAPRILPAPPIASNTVAPAAIPVPASVLKEPGKAHPRARKHR